MLRRRIMRPLSYNPAETTHFNFDIASERIIVTPIPVRAECFVPSRWIIFHLR